MTRPAGVHICGCDHQGRERRMNEDVLNTSVRRFLKTVGVTSQREIEKAVRAAVASGKLKGNEALPAKMTLTVGGRKIAYTATAGTLALFDQSGEKSASVFYTAYISKGADGARRPLTFAFNGGPGAASVYLNLGLAGPRIVDFGPEGRDGAAAKLVDNPDSWLAFTDLVMIDPIGTGWTRTAKPDEAKNFYGVRSDANF